MNRSSFLNYFLLSQAMHVSNQSHTPHKLKKAAVLIALVERENGLNIVLTERALHLRHHPGQVSFPGGKYEPLDTSLQHTAIRETGEEIGIQAQEIEMIGQLTPLSTVSGFQVSPFVAFVHEDFQLEIDTQEVKSVFEIPLHFLLDTRNFHQQHLIANKKRHFTYCIGYQNHLIWGATAQILKNLQQLLLAGSS